MKENSNLILVPLQRYENLIVLETRVNAIVERIMHDESFDKEDMLWLLDTEVSVELAYEMRNKTDENVYERRGKRMTVYEFCECYVKSFEKMRIWSYDKESTVFIGCFLEAMKCEYADCIIRSFGIEKGTIVINI